MGLKLFKTVNGGLKIGDDIFKDTPNCMVLGDQVRFIIGSTTIQQRRYDFFEKENGDAWANADEIASYIDLNFSNGGGDGGGVTKIFDQDHFEEVDVLGTLKVQPKASGLVEKLESVGYSSGIPFEEVATINEIDTGNTITRLIQIVGGYGNGLSFFQGGTLRKILADPLVFFTPQNLYYYSEQFNNAQWDKINGSTVTPNSYAAPNSNPTADTFTVSTSSFGCIIKQLKNVTNQQYTLSVHVKRINYDFVGLRIGNSVVGERIPFINLTSLVTDVIGISGASMGFESLSNGWIRIWLTFTPSANANANIDIALTTSNGDCDRIPLSGQSVALWGAQFNQGTIRPYTLTEVNNIP